MLELLFVGLFQAAVGEPEQPPAPTKTETTAEASATTAEAVSEAPPPRRCRHRTLTGSRLRTVVQCGDNSGPQDIDTRDALHDIQRPPVTSNPN